MDSKRMRLERNLQSQSQIMLDLKIWQNIQISKCIDDNYINRLLETTRSVISQQSDDEAQFVQQQQQILEDEAINTAITSYGLKKQQIFSDDESSSELPCCSCSSSRLPTSLSQEKSNTFENAAIVAEDAICLAISSYGLQKENFRD